MIKPGMLLAGRFEVIEPLGEGGMGALFLAKQIGGERKVAVKVVNPSLLGSETARARCRREGRLLQKLNHPNIVEIYDAGVTDDGDYFLVLQHLKGRDLRTILKERRRLELDEVVDIGRQLLSALALVHETGLVHRDIKPSNVIWVDQIGAARLIKLIDFGIARPLRPDPMVSFNTKSGTQVGTPEYMAPEHIRGEAVDARSDLYSTAMLLCELAVGYRARQGGLTYEIMSKRLSCEPITLPAWLENTPLGTVIERATRPNPDDRYQTALQMVEALPLSRRRTRF